MYEDASQVAADAVGSIRTVASFCAEGKVMELYNDKCKVPLQKGVRQGFVSGAAFGFSNFVMYASYALCFWFGGKLVKEGKAEFQEVFKVRLLQTLNPKTLDSKPLNLNL
jgi:ATP-binding cassette subfamily B (MDR/TAP) protein 1